MAFECKYCEKEFKSESVFMRHSCPEMQRMEVLRSPTGQSAYVYYSAWMKGYGRTVPPIETFAGSRYFTSFVKFATYLIEHSIPTPMAYVQQMIKHDISPMLWCQQECYLIYLTYLDSEVTPMKQVEISLTSLLRLSEQMEIEIHEAFTKFTPQDMMELLLTRSVSPWLLLASRKFKEWLLKQHSDDVKMINRVINPHVWLYRMECNKEVMAEIRDICKELGL